MTCLDDVPSAPAATTRISTPGPRGSRARVPLPVLTVAVLNECDLVQHGLAAMLGPFSQRIQVLHADDEQLRTADLRHHVTLYDCYDASGRLRRPTPLLHARGRVVAYSWVTSGAAIQAALAAGLHGYLGKSLAAAQLASALSRVDRNERPVVPGSQIGPRAAEERRRLLASVGLAPREEEVLRLIAQGHRNREIAQLLCLSENSIKSYIRSGYRKMGTTTRSQAVLWAVANGLDEEAWVVPAAG